MLSSPAGRADLSRSRVARYIQLATLFRRRIESGQWPTGSQIPTIDELTEQCGVARATIRQAVGVLEANGLISRFRGKGTFVLQRPEQFHLELTTDWSGLLNPRPGAIIELIEDEAAVSPPDLPHEIGLTAASYRRLKRRHVHEDRPYLVADLYIDSSLAYDLPEEVYRTLTAMRLASAIAGVQIVQAHQTLSIGTADVEIAEQLDLPLNAPICYVDRSVVNQLGRVFVISKGIYRGDMVRMDLKLR